MTRFERDGLYRKASKNRASEPPKEGDIGEIEGDGREEWSAVQEQVWEREETYWELTAAGDVERFLALWDDRFVGWPDAEETPITVAELRTEVADQFEDVRSNEFDYTLDPLAIAVAGNVGIAYYRVRTEHREEGGAETTTYRVTHTWRKAKNEWKIVGGMSASISDG